MSQQKLKCVYSGCGKEPLKSSKDGHCIYHAKAEDKNEREFKEALKKYIEERSYDFSGFVFVGSIDFKNGFGVTIFEKANFMEASFQGEAVFSEISFQGWTLFNGTSFQERAYFTKTSFQERVYFSRASFQGGAVFAETSFQEEVHFMQAEFRGISHIFPKCIEGNVSFLGTILENVSLTPLNLNKDIWVDFKNARLRSVNIRREDIESHIRQEKEKRFSKARKIYLLLKNNFHTLGRYDDESWAFKKEKDMERKSYFHTRRLRWLGSMFWNLLYGYGERPFRIFGWCGFLLLFSSFIYWLSKGVFHMMGTRPIPVGDYWNNLYFSVVTFTTLGYGDFRPIGPVKVLASIEALLGIFLIALFIFAFARKTGGR